MDADGTLALKSPEDFKRLEGILAKQLICRRQSGWTSATTAEEVLAHLLDGKFSGAGAFRAQAGSTSLFLSLIHIFIAQPVSGASFVGIRISRPGAPEHIDNTGAVFIT